MDTRYSSQLLEESFQTVPGDQDGGSDTGAYFTSIRTSSPEPMYPTPLVTSTQDLPSAGLNGWNESRNHQSSLPQQRPTYDSPAFRIPQAQPPKLRSILKSRSPSPTSGLQDTIQRQPTQLSELQELPLQTPFPTASRSHPMHSATRQSTSDSNETSSINLNIESPTPPPAPHVQLPINIPYRQRTVYSDWETPPASRRPTLPKPSSSLPPGHPSPGVPADPPTNYQIPRHTGTANSWEISVLKAAKKYDEDMSKGWKDDIDTLMVFAGLFSAVVTAFTVESYRWLSTDPEDTIVALLTQISRQLPNPSVTEPDPALLTSSFSPFGPAPSSVVRINSFWFLSIIFSLLSAFFGILCKQWLREHARDIHTRSRAEALALHQLRNESFEKWGVTSIIATLPVLLEISLLFFFAGLLELLWVLHMVPFALAAAAVGAGGVLYMVTTILPSVNIIRGFAKLPSSGSGQEKFPDTPAFHFICPYKSPQAWGMFCVVRKLVGTIPSFSSLGCRWMRWRTPGVLHKLHRASHWPTLDLHHIRIYDVQPSHLRELHATNLNVSPTTRARNNLKVYELEGLRTLVNMFHDTPSMEPHLKKLLMKYDASVIMAAVFDEWKICTWRAAPITFRDVEACLEDLGRQTSQHTDEKLEMSLSCLNSLDGTNEDDLNWPQSSPSLTESPLHLPAYVELLYFQHFWRQASAQSIVPIAELLDYTRKFFTRSDVPQRTKIRFPIPFNAIVQLWTHSNPAVRDQSSDFIDFYKTGWETYGAEEKDDERFALIAALARHILEIHQNAQPLRMSALVGSSTGLKFLEFVNEGIVIHRLFASQRYHDSQRATGMKDWVEAMWLVERELDLERHFAPIPNFGGANAPTSGAGSSLQDSVDRVLPHVGNTNGDHIEFRNEVENQV
ncbi:hypothetical protein PQX77_011099 [Marasmius sp. AFHP31]|nr:hypothetical protein PQX77_011099 [Marasmius sp. AFHP31]